MSETSLDAFPGALRHAATGFDWSAVEQSLGEPAPAAPVWPADVAKVGAFIAEELLAHDHGGSIAPLGTTIRVVLLRELLAPTGATLSDMAERLGCTRQALCVAGRKLSKRLGIRGSWMRSEDAREIFRQRALGVHRGTWEHSDHWDRHLVRMARLKKAKARRAA